MSAQRLFVALEVPPAVRQALAAQAAERRPRLPAARWVRPDIMHLTLAFLGDTAPRSIPALEAALTAAFADHPPLVLRLTAVGGFPASGRVGVVWTGVEADGDLDALHASVASAVASALPAKASPRRAFHPHLTLARCRTPWPRAALGLLDNLVAGASAAPFAVTAGTLFASTLHATGAEHRALACFPLVAER